MSLVAPTDGATVYVRTLVVEGRVNPADAHVLVAGQRASVRRGVFRLRMRLPIHVNHIGILATAPGYVSRSLTTTVRVSRSASAAAAPAPAKRRSGTELPSDFGVRGEAICSAAEQQISALPKPTPATFTAITKQILEINAHQNQQLYELAGPARGLPAVRQFFKNLRASFDLAVTLARDLAEGNSAGAAHLVRANFVDAPRWWEDAGKLGVPDCGAVWKQVGG